LVASAFDRAPRRSPMPVAPTYPGVYIEELPSGVRTITGVSTSVTAFLGYTLRGPIDDPVQLFSFDYDTANATACSTSRSRAWSSARGSSSRARPRSSGTSA
jgi:phage tail sheath protein FI